jgi:SAM-dependent methyltransferase
VAAPPTVADRIRRWADRLAETPLAFHWLRKLPEANYRATKARIRAVCDALGRPRVLDAGCGTGEYAGLFEPERYLGIDLHPGYVALARRRHPRHHFEVADLRAWDGRGDRFDLVLVNGVLHHLDDGDARALLANAARQRAPGGTLLVIEDVSLPRPGLGTRLVHALDHGHFIRDAARWRALVAGVAPIARSETYLSGVCPYHLMVCRDGDPACCPSTT